MLQQHLQRWVRKEVTEILKLVKSAGRSSWVQQGAWILIAFEMQIGLGWKPIEIFQRGEGTQLQDILLHLKKEVPEYPWSGYSWEMKWAPIDAAIGSSSVPSKHLWDARGCSQDITLNISNSLQAGSRVACVLYNNWLLTGVMYSRNGKMCCYPGTMRGWILEEEAEISVCRGWVC